jgi:hypothetical protein
MSPTAIFNRFDLSASKTKALLLMNADRCKGIAEASGFAKHSMLI